MAETTISTEEAEKKYGITCPHGKMDNGELRFRLIKNDGTAYIRTVSTKDSGWQQAHYHKKVKETYIVQKGWIGYAELNNNTMVLKIYIKDECFTTHPNIIHNIYMPKNSVIHTVKHGDSKREERLIDSRTVEFTNKTKFISEKEIKNSAKKNKTIAFQDNIDNYNEAYRHFDNLIWQVPAWSSGIFAAVLVGVININNSEGTGILIELSGLCEKTILSIFFGFLGIFILILSYTLCRFRWHQIKAKNYI